MPIFEVEAGGKTFEVDAPSMPAALDAFKVFSTPKQDSQSTSSVLKEFWDNPPPGGFTSTFLKPVVEGLGAFGEAAGGRLDPANPEQRSIAADKMAGLAPAVTLAPAPGGILAAPAGSLTSGMAQRATAPPINKTLEAAARIDVPIPKFLASDNMTTQRLAAGVKNIPGAGNQIVEATQNVTKGLGEAGRGVAEQFGTGSAEVAGSAAKDSLIHWITEGSKKPASRLYDAVDGMVDQNHIRPLHATGNAVSEIMAQRANSKISGSSPAVQNVLEAVQSEGMNYAGIKGLRSFLGEMTPQEMVARGISKKEADRIYSALTDDLKGTILEAGGPEAVSAFERANSLFKLTAAQRADLSKIVGSKGDAAPEAVFSRLVSYAGSKSSADINRLNLARKRMGAEAWNEVASAVVSKLGRDPQGNFSPDRFFTAYGNIAPDAKRVLFGSTGRDDLARALDDINTVVNAFKQKITQFGNPSGTAQNLIGASMAGAAFSDPLHVLKALGGVAGGNVLAKALSQPATAKAVANYVKAQRTGNSVAIQIATQALARALGSPSLTAKLQADPASQQGPL